MTNQPEAVDTIPVTTNNLHVPVPVPGKLPKVGYPQCKIEQKY